MKVLDHNSQEDLFSKKCSKRVFPTGHPFVDEQKIKELICYHFDTSMEKMSLSSRKREIAHPRFVCMYLLTKYTRRSYKDIGGMFGGRDHTTVLNAKTSLKDLMDTDPNIYAEVRFIEERLLGNSVLVDSTEGCHNIFMESVNILSRLRMATSDWKTNGGDDKRAEKLKWEKIADDFLIKIQGK